MLLSLLLVTAPLLPAAQELSQAPLQGAVSRELRLYEIADLVDPRAAAQEALSRELLLNVLDLSAADAEAQAALSGGDRMALSLLRLAMHADKSRRQQEGQRAAALPQEQEAARREAEQAQAQALAALGYVGAAGSSRTRYPFDSTEELLDAVRTFMLPAYVGSGASLKVEEHDRRPVLIAYLSGEQAAWLQRFLDFQREHAEWTGTVHVQVLQAVDASHHLPPDLADAALIPDKQAYEAQSARIVESGFHPLSDPTMTLLPWQKGELAVQNEVSYVKEWTLHTVEPGGVQIADPTVDTIEEGLVFSCRVRKVEGGSYGMHLLAHYSELQRPIPTREVHPEGQTSDLHLQVGAPELHTMDVETDVRLQDGASLRLPSVSTDGGKDLVLLVTFHRTEMPTVGLPSQQR